ncbi:NADase-type glycan-binding domain-containing protein [Nibribacter koreensis]|uniref:NAD glycohydrolase translocation F5/8 type C domain-containing protein n=1 Tax=Nibribacter koreensis TaxID=1084519 RepID=A0ABP8FZH7_9BACT
MRTLFALPLLLVSLVSYSQKVPEMQPALGHLVEKSTAGEAEFIRKQRTCEELWRKTSYQGGHEKLSVNEKKVLATCDEEFESYWDILGVGCSWYCGGGQDTTTATSVLKPVNGTNYSASNAHDLSYKTAWIEGAEGYGIGEKLTYHFPADNPRITKVIVVNGYVKSDQAWKDNTRVKKLMMYLNGKPFRVLNLQDTKKKQSFSFSPLGNDNTQAKSLSKKHTPWTLTFEILEVYPGAEYKDTAITEIYFDGIDVH